MIIPKFVEIWTLDNWGSASSQASTQLPLPLDQTSHPEPPRSGAPARRVLGGESAVS
jgi:hypothetical protein